MKLNKILTLLFLFMALIGCSSVQPLPKPPPSEMVDTKLAEAAVAATHSLENLAEVEQAIHPQAKVIPPPNPASYGMAAKTSIDWIGPIEPIVQRIAHVSGYSLQVLGKPPAIPVLVTLSANNTAIGDILRDIGFQADKRARILVFPTEKVIQLRYAKN